jgi:hypothetical protein
MRHYVARFHYFHVAGKRHGPLLEKKRRALFIENRRQHTASARRAAIECY